MTRPITLFTLFGIATRITPLGLVSTLALVPLLAWLAAQTANGPSLTFWTALGAGALATFLYVISEWLHQMGHARAARATGYPMRGLRYVFAGLSVCEYPPDEPELPAALHIRRALGGFWINVVIGLLLAPYAFFAWVQGGAWGWVLAFTAIVNFVVLGLGALLPIDIPGVFTIDGGTLWRYWRKR
jgi:hypothetical protein